ncbi:hypothetical protein ACJX0J_016563, partial [Zea mays]
RNVIYYKFRRKPNWLLPIMAFPIDIGTFVPETIFLLFLCYGMNIPYQFVILTHSDHFSLTITYYQTSLIEYFSDRPYPLAIIAITSRKKRYWDRLIDYLDRYLWACAQRIQTGIHKQKGEFVVTFSCRVKKGFT